MISIATIWVMTIWLLVEATERFFTEPEVKGDVMLIVAVLSLIFNLIQMKILHSGEGHYHLGGEDHDHDHGCSGHDHGHSHAHEHTHEHTHDHTHEHAHGHSHEHAHGHSHEHAHDHSN
jgi:hypothetical protein